LEEYEAGSTDSAAHRAGLTASAAEKRRDAERYKETIMYLRECIKNPDSYEQSKLHELLPRLELSC
jgi:hypothetical protein